MIHSICQQPQYQIHTLLHISPTYWKVETEGKWPNPSTILYTSEKQLSPTVFLQFSPVCTEPGPQPVGCQSCSCCLRYTTQTVPLAELATYTGNAVLLFVLLSIQYFSDRQNTSFGFPASDQETANPNCRLYGADHASCFRCWGKFWECKVN